MLRGLLVLLFIIISLFFIPLKFYFRLYRNTNIFHVTLLIKIWKIPFSFKINNLVTRFFWVLSKNRFWEKPSPLDLQAQQIAWKRLIFRLLLFRKIYSSVLQKVVCTFRKIKRPIKINKIRLHTEIALQDAARTALAVGSLWWTWGFIYSQLDRYFKISQTANNLVIIPKYERKNLFTIDFSCIFEFHLGHIIIIIYYLFKNVENIRKLLRRVSH